ncbi:hypothetical protein VTN96DRAFT_1551 [Rasamsonia emersonii]
MGRLGFPNSKCSAWPLCTIPPLRLIHGSTAPKTLRTASLTRRWSSLTRPTYPRHIIGPGVYDIHSPRVPSEQIKDRILFLRFL